jgi:carbamoyltransferase
MIVLGISAFYHDSAAAIVRDGEIVAAAQEERFTRKKHDASFPANALRFCVQQAGVAWSDIDFVTFYEKPFLKFERTAREPIWRLRRKASARSAWRCRCG